MDNFGLYVIATRPALSYELVAEICVRQRVRFLQLREKHLPDNALLDAAKRIKNITRGTETLFVVNDRPDIALLADADVLHLGQDDLPIEEARKIVGSMPIGLSTHSIEQAREALTKQPLYIGFGPIYPTTTKTTPDPTVGTELLNKVIEFATCPVVAIGGIFPKNIDSIQKAGAKNLSLVRYLMTEQMEDRVVEIQNKLR